MQRSSETAWTVVRRRVSVAGYVRRADGSPVRGGWVTCSTTKAVIRADGLYFFLDLPSGKHELKGIDDRGCAIEPRSVKVPKVTGRPGGSPLLGTDLMATDTPFSGSRPP